MTVSDTQMDAGSAGDAQDLPTTQTGRAALTLRQLLLRGAFKPGERLREIPLAEQLGVSRIPLRLALERLAHEGFLELRAKRGFIVQQFSIADVYDAIELRGTLEGTAAHFAAERPTNERGVDHLHAINRQMSELLQQQPVLTLEVVTQFSELNSAFHAKILDMAQSRLLRRTLEQVCTLPFAAPSALMRRDYSTPESHALFTTSLRQHLGITEAIAAHDGARAAEVAREHTSVARMNLDMALRDPGGEDSLPSLKMVGRKPEK